jgi:hypothetical protein
MMPSEDCVQNQKTEALQLFRIQDLSLVTPFEMLVILHFL